MRVSHQYTDMSMTTFGYTPAAQTLVKMLKERNDLRLTRKTLSFINRYSTLLALIRRIKVRSNREDAQCRNIKQLIYNDAVSELTKSKIDEDIRNYILNVLNTHKQKYK